MWHLKDHDYFTASFDSIHDTIPWLIRNVKDQLARQYKLDYPFKRFSIIEVPVQFASYERAWSQAQETVQPEMVLFPEKGAIFWELDVKGRLRIRSGGRERMRSLYRKPRCVHLVILPGCLCGQKVIITFQQVVGDGEIFRLWQILISFSRRFIISGTIFIPRNGL